MKANLKDALYLVKNVRRVQCYLFNDKTEAGRLLLSVEAYLSQQIRNAL